ncbi:hypothetical protein WJX74_007778 [Apatococcus lobatus]|uniref:Uncharacterized protein n=1 Tax=Apatococcus lobatus TaxID=904363 RepID=A0AAW1SF07_9CHLO
MVALQLCSTIKTQAASDPIVLCMQIYGLTFTASVEAELLEERQRCSERLAEWNEDDLEAQGVALLWLQAESLKSQDNSSQYSFIKIVDGKLGKLLDNSFGKGNIALVTPADDMPGTHSCRAIVIHSTSFFVQVKTDWKLDGMQEYNEWRLDLYSDDASFTRCLQAIERFASEPTDQSSQGLRQALLGSRPGVNLSKVSANPPSWAKDDAVTLTCSRIKDLQNKGTLNVSHGAAIMKALQSTLTLWQGPPGTGKTLTLAHHLKASCSVLPKGSILACAASNVAVDTLAAALLDLDVSFVRVGNPVRVAAAVQPRSLDVLCQDHPLWKEAAAMMAKASSLPKEKDGHLSMEEISLMEEAALLQERAKDFILSNAEVVVTTCVGAGSAVLCDRNFKMAAIDEASQSIEPAALIPFMNNCEAALLVGDDKQLPPTIFSRKAKLCGLQESLFVRLQKSGLKPEVLDVQYRMHPTIASFPNSAFYNSNLANAVSPAQRIAPHGFAWPNRRKPVAFLDIPAQEVSAGHRGSSKANPKEAQRVASLLTELMNANQPLSSGEGIGIITPYTGQVREIKLQIRQAGDDKLIAALEEGILEVKTVDGFQGREKEVIIFSAVRSNPANDVGFLEDRRRLNVALTRAKRGLIVLGSRATLNASPIWKKWLAWIDAERLAVGRNLEAEGDIADMHYDDDDTRI